jgi:hypothetical protein
MTLLGRTILATCGACLCAATGLAALRQPAPAAGAPSNAPAEGVLSDRPATAGRVVRRFDFDERSFNTERVPRHWFRAQSLPPDRERPGFPKWNEAGFDSTFAVSGTTSVKLPVAGGSCALRLSGTLLPILPDADLAVSAMIRTDGLRHSRAMISVQLLDQTGQLVSGALRYSVPVLSENAWQPVDVELRSTPPEAAFLQIELLVLQPDQLPGAAATDVHAVTLQDLQGAAWFDDVTVRQLPRLTIRSLSGPMVSAEGHAKLRVDVRDQAGEPLLATMTVMDVRGETVARQTRQLPVGGEVYQWPVELPIAGWYRARVDVSGGSSGLSRAELTLVRVPAASTRSPLTLGGPVRLGLLAEDVPVGSSDLILSFVQRGAFSAVSLSANSLLLDPTFVSPLHQTTETLIAAGTRVAMAWNSVPADLQEQLSVRELDPAGLADMDPEKWFVRLEPVLDRYGRRITSWRFGKLAVELGASPPDMPSLVRRMNTITEVLRKHAAGSRVGVPWRSEWSAPLDGVAARMVLVPGSLPPEQVAQSVLSNRDADLLVIQTLSEGMSEESRCIDAAQRLVHAWRGASPQASLARGLVAESVLAVERMWTVRPGGQLDPTPEAAVLMGLGRKLLGRRVVSAVVQDPYTQAYLFVPTNPQVWREASLTEPSPTDRFGAIVAWSEEPGKYLARHMGTGKLAAYDMFGNPVALPEPDSTGFYRIPLSPAPILIEGVDAELVEFTASVRLTPSFIPASASVQDARLTVTNPWPIRISGAVQILVSEADRRRGWSVGPASQVTFQLQPGETATLPFTVTISPSEVVGERSLTAVVRVEGERTYGPMRLPLPVQVGVPGLDFSVVLSPSGEDLIATVTTSNSGTRSRTLQLEAAAPSQRRQNQSISQLQPGETAVRRFVMPNAGALKGGRMWFSGLDVDSGERLSKIIDVP